MTVIGLTPEGKRRYMRDSAAIAKLAAQAADPVTDRDRRALQRLLASDDEHAMKVAMARRARRSDPRIELRMRNLVASAAASTVEPAVAWEATLVPEGTLTDDGRAFAPGALTWRELPLTLAAMVETSAAGGHDGAQIAGRIDRIWREGNLVKGAGVFDGGEFGADIARLVGNGTLRGLSVDVAIGEDQVVRRGDYFDANGMWLGPLAQLFVDESEIGDQEVFLITDGVIGMATVCPFQAFADATISLVASGAGATYAAKAELELVPVTAAAAGRAPLLPPAEWFDDPRFSELTPLTISDDGQVFGHAWSWGTCHLGRPDVCVTAPQSLTDYAYFHLGEVECADGERVAVGKITLDAPHAGDRLSRVAATAHYDHTGTVAAHVRCGEDEHGGWVAGAIVPDLPVEKLRLLRGSSLSGDWRGVDGNLELVALLAVNVPGFPVPRPRALVASGRRGVEEVLALTAAGVVRNDEQRIRELAASVAA